jgi:hypothetical protein
MRHDHVQALFERVRGQKLMRGDLAPACKHYTLHLAILQAANREVDIDECLYRATRACE